MLEHVGGKIISKGFRVDVSDGFAIPQSPWKTFEASHCSCGALRSLHSGYYLTKNCHFSYGRNDSFFLYSISLTNSQSFTSNDQIIYI